MNKLGLQVQQAVKTWEQINKAPAFVRELDSVQGECSTCHGGGQIYVSFAKDSAPHKTAAPAGLKLVSLFFDGNGKWGQGWYAIERTSAFDCPSCHGQRN